MLFCHVACSIEDATQYVFCGDVPHGSAREQLSRTPPCPSPRVPEVVERVGYESEDKGTNTLYKKRRLSYSWKSGELTGAAESMIL